MSIRHSIIGLFLIFGLIMFGVVACGGDDKSEAGVAGSSRSEYDNQNQTTSESSETDSSTDNTANSDVAAILQELPSTVMFLQGETLMRLGFDDSGEASIVAEDVAVETIRFVPDQAAVVYEAGRTLYVYDADEDTSLELGPLRFGSNGFIENWSPNREWFLHRIAGTTLFHIEGMATYDLSMMRIGNTYRWTTNNELLVIDDNGRQGDRFAYQQVNRIDLETGEPIPIDIGLDPVNNDQMTMEEALSTIGYDLVPVVQDEYPQIAVPREVFDSPSIICNTWTIADGNLFEDGENIYQSPPIYLLSEVNVLSDQELIFLKWTVEDCGLSDPQAELIRYNIDMQAEQVLTDTVFSDRPPSRDNSLFSDNGVDPRYAISPDGQFIMWIGGSIDSGTSSLNLINLVTGTQTEIMEIISDGNISSFVNNQLISEVYWLE